MKTAWSEERLGYQPSQFEKANDDTYIQRRNIRRDILTDDSTESEPGWICESRFISDDIYEDFMEYCAYWNDKYYMSGFSDAIKLIVNGLKL